MHDVSRLSDWGPSVNVNGVFGPSDGASGRRELELEMQSGRSHPDHSGVLRFSNGGRYRRKADFCIYSALITGCCPSRL
jgi:hypothetical protein